MNLKRIFSFKNAVILLMSFNPFLDSYASGDLFIQRKDIQRDDSESSQKKYILKLKPTTLKRLEKLPASSKVYLTAREEKVEDNKNQQDKLDIHFRYSQSFLSIQGTEGQGAEGELKSKASPGYHVLWTAYRQKKLSIDLGHSFSFYDFGKAESRTLKEPKQEMQSFFIEGNYRLSDDLTASFELGTKRQFFFRSTDIETVEIDNVSVPYYEVGLAYEAYRMDKTEFIAKGGLRHHLPFETNVFKGSGTGVTASLLVYHRTKSLNLSGELFFSRDFFDTTPIEFERSEAGLVFGLIFDFGDGA